MADAFRVLELSRGLGAGGAERALLERLVRIQASGLPITTTVWNTKPEVNDYSARLHEAAASLVETPIVSLKGFRRLRKMADHKSTDCVVVHSPSVGLIVGFLRKIGRAHV